jgi:hypothetical protein
MRMVLVPQQRVQRSADPPSSLLCGETWIPLGKG